MELLDVVITTELIREPKDGVSHYTAMQNPDDIQDSLLKKDFISAANPSGITPIKDKNTNETVGFEFDAPDTEQTRELLRTLMLAHDDIIVELISHQTGNTEKLRLFSKREPAA